MEEANYTKILEVKIAYYGNTEAAHEFAAQEYHKQMSKKEGRDYQNAISHEKMFNHFVERKRSGSWILTCHPNPEIIGDYHVTDRYYYLCMEILEGKHNDFLQKIIDGTNSADN